jgi:hypothetical protein
MRTTIRSIMKSCKAFQVHKKWRLKNGHLPPKTIIAIPFKVLCVDLVGPFSLKGKDGTVVDFAVLI